MSLPKYAKLSITVLIVALAASSVYAILHNDGAAGQQSTDDAYVTADSTFVAPQVEGNIVELAVADHQAVRKGQLLARIDERPYVVAVDAAQAELSTAQANVARTRAILAQQASEIRRAAAAIDESTAALKFARTDAARYADLASDGSATLQDQQQATAKADSAIAHHAAAGAALAGTQQQVQVLAAQLAQSQAEVERKRAALAAAQLNLSYTRVLAPVDGVVGQRSVRLGGYAKTGVQLLAIVPVQQAYVEANFRETQLSGIRAGQKVAIAIDMLPGTVLKGTVASVAPASSVSFSPVAPDNATGNFTKVVQRLPVKIVLDPGQPSVQRLRVGMSVTPTITIEGNGT